MRACFCVIVSAWRGTRRVVPMLGRVACYYGDLWRCVFVAIGVRFRHLFADTTIMLHRAVLGISACITTYTEVVKEAASACGDAVDRAVVDRRSYCSFSDAGYTLFFFAGVHRRFAAVLILFHGGNSQTSDGAGFVAAPD